MLSIKNVSTGYGKKQVLYNVSLEVKEGEVVLLSGGNGSGKSTLLKCIYNLLPPWSGSIKFNGNNTVSNKPSELIHKGIVYIPQKNFNFENLTVLENLQIAGTKLPRNLLNERITEVIELTNLSKFSNRKPFNLSGGERKLLAFGMGLIHKPKLLLFDEPFAGVDIQNTENLIKLFKESIINPDVGLIIVEHRNEAQHLFNRKIHIDLGILKNIKKQSKNTTK